MHERVRSWSEQALTWAGVGSFVFWYRWRERLREILYPRNTVGPFGTPGAMFCVVRRPDGSRVLDDLVGCEPAAQAQLLELLEVGVVAEFHAVQLEEPPC